MQTITLVSIFVVALVAGFVGISDAAKNMAMPNLCESAEELKSCRQQCGRDRVSLWKLTVIIISLDNIWYF